jgi:hypothetical protein
MHEKNEQYRQNFNLKILKTYIDRRIILKCIARKQGLDSLDLFYLAQVNVVLWAAVNTIRNCGFFN